MANIGNAVMIVDGILMLLILIYALIEVHDHKTGNVIWKPARLAVDFFVAVVYGLPAFVICLIIFVLGLALHFSGR